MLRAWILATVAVVLYGCGRDEAPVPPAVQRAPAATVVQVRTVDASALSEEQSGALAASDAPGLAEIASATVEGIEETGTVTLLDGRYEGAPYAAGGASRPSLLLLRRLSAVADQDGIPGGERAVLLSASSGGSGERIYLAVFARVSGAVRNLATLRVGDRVKLRALAAENGEYLLDVVETGAGEPACCGTQLARLHYRLDGDRLVETAHEVQGTLSLALLEGVEWALEARAGSALPAQQSPPTLTLEAGRLSGFGGCNRFSGALQESAPGQLGAVPRQLVSTRMACPPPEMELERVFLDDLARASAYTFLEGRLALSSAEGGLLVFGRAASAPAPH